MSRNTPVMLTPSLDIKDDGESYALSVEVFAGFCRQIFAIENDCIF